MRTATITEAKNRLSALIDQVKAGETILILDRGRPVARLEPTGAGVADAEGRLARLERAGLVARAQGAPPAELLQHGPPRPRRAGAALAALLDERRGGR